jgi:hypothetical protein
MFQKGFLLTLVLMAGVFFIVLWPKYRTKQTWRRMRALLEPTEYSIGSETDQKVIVRLLRFDRGRETKYPEVIEFVHGIGRFATWSELRALQNSGLLPKGDYKDRPEIPPFPIVIHYADGTFGKIGLISPLWYNLAWPRETRFAVVLK